MRNMRTRLKIILMVLMAMGVISTVAQADTVASYMTISNNIPKMAMKPDQQSQAWVRSARNILTSTDETMAQTVIAMNALAAKQGKPVFCFSPSTPFDAGTVDQLIQKTYADLLKTQGSSVGNMSVSDILIIGMNTQYSCSSMPSQMTQSMPNISGASTATTMPAMQQPAVSATPAPQPVPELSMPGYETSPTQISVSNDSPPVL